MTSFLLIPFAFPAEANQPGTVGAQMRHESSRLEAALKTGDFAEARTAYREIVTSEDAPPYMKAMAQLRLAESLAREKKWEEATEAFEEARRIPGVPTHLALEAKERAEEAARVKAGKPARDPEAHKMLVPELPHPGKEFFVSPKGDDRAVGTKSRPLASLAGARDAIRGFRVAKGGIPDGGVTVWIRRGEYPVTEALVLSEEDSGTRDAPIVYRPWKREKPILTGGLAVNGMVKVEDTRILTRLPEESRDKIMAVDLRKQGITNYGEIAPLGFGATPHPMMEVFFNGEALRLARWPNEGFVKTGKVHDPGDRDEKRGALFEYTEERPGRWKEARDIWMYGYWYHLWADGSVAVENIDTNNKMVKAAHCASYGTRADHPYFYFNLMEEIDEPGEYYLDREHGILYLYPPSNSKAAKLHISMLEETIIRMEGASHIKIMGLTLELGRMHGIEIVEGNDCLVSGCTIRRFRGDGVLVSGGKNHGILGCDIHHMGRGGTRVAGGDRKTLDPGGHFIENCHIHDLSRLDRTYTPAVLLDGCGNRIAHNLFHNIPCHAMRVEGNDHVIELNAVHSVVWESDDQGGLDMWYNPTYRGNIIRHNYWHHIASGRWCGQAGIRLDDAICGTLITGNIFYRCSDGNFGGVQIHGGKDNWIDNNLFIDCKFGISFSRWGQARWEETLKGPDCQAKMKDEVDMDSPPYSTRYPELANLWDGADINNIWRNVFYDCGEVLVRDGGIQVLLDNLVFQENPGFKSATRENFALKRDSRVYREIDFRPIPFEEIGLYRSPHRATWPVKTKHIEKR